MASNPFANKVKLADGTVIMDVTDTTATEADVLEGLKFTLASGAKGTGALKVGNARIWHGASSTAAATRAKAVTIAELTELSAGDLFVITFSNAQTYNGAPQMNINGLGAIAIQRLSGTNAARYEWSAGETVIFLYDGTHFLILNGGFATTTYYGRTKLYTGAGSNSAELALTPASLYNMANRTICPYYSTSETYAVGDKVRYGDYIYECVTEITKAEAWTAAHWEIAPTLQEQITALDGNDIVGMSVSTLKAAESKYLVGLTVDQLKSK